MYYVSSASTISHQPTFKNVGFSNAMEELGKESAVMNPDFKEYIDAGLLRRMSKILRMAVTCASDCLKQAGLEQPDSIVVGTGLGCLQDTEKFLNNFLTIEGLLPPTAFIQSTHNTIAGQISLSLGNHGYNMTHTQNSLSFEHAMFDAMLLLDEEDKNVLVGAADEYISLLGEIGEHFDLEKEVFLTSGASFFIVSNERTNKTLAQIMDVQTVGLVHDVSGAISSFLERNDLNASQIDQVYFAGFNTVNFVSKLLLSVFGKDNAPELIGYPQFSGWYPTNSAFALHLALDKMAHNKKINTVLICNNLFHNNLGLTLVQSLEA